MKILTIPSWLLSCADPNLFFLHSIIACIFALHYCINWNAIDVQLITGYLLALTQTVQNCDITALCWLLVTKSSMLFIGWFSDPASCYPCQQKFSINGSWHIEEPWADCTCCILVLCPDYTSHKETVWWIKLNFLRPITGMWQRHTFYSQAVMWEGARLFTSWAFD